MTTHAIHADTVVVGVDVHKHTHTAVAMSAFGEEKAKIVFSNRTIDDFVSWLSDLCSQTELIVALEDVRGNGRRLARALHNEGFIMRYVPPVLTDRERHKTTNRNKSDYLDAKRIGKVILHTYEKTLPLIESITPEHEITLADALGALLAERTDLVKSQTALKNQLHVLLHQYYGDMYANSIRQTFNCQHLDFYRDDLGDHDDALSKVIMRKLTRLMFTMRQIADVTTEFESIAEGSPAITTLRTIKGCGCLTACGILSEIVNIRRFGNREQLAMYAGVAPRDNSSGATKRHCTNQYGNRALNRHIHTIAMSQISTKDTLGRTYYAKKLKEGKTKLWAIRCLKLQITHTVFSVLQKA